MDRKSASELQEHMLGTYGALRVMLTVIGIALPVVVVVSGWFQRGEYWIASSISDYYHLPATIPFFTARDFLVGGLTLSNGLASTRSPTSAESRRASSSTSPAPSRSP